MKVAKEDTMSVPICILDEMLRIEDVAAKAYYVNAIMMYLLSGEEIEPLPTEDGMNSLVNISKILIDNTHTEDK